MLKINELYFTSVERAKAYCVKRGLNFRDYVTGEQERNLLEREQTQLYKKCVVKYIRELYDINDEFDIINCKDENDEKYQSYRQYVAMCKARAREEVYGNTEQD